MNILSIGTQEYDVDIEKLLKRRLRQAGWEPDLGVSFGDEQVVSAEVGSPEELSSWIMAIGRLLLKDMAHFEMARLINELPLTLAQKQMALPEAIRSARSFNAESRILRSLREHFDEHEHLNLEGFMRFRMKDVLEGFSLCVDRAAEEILLRSEYLELMSVLSAYVRMRPPCIREISIILHPDGSCTLTDDSDSRIDCESCSDDSVMNVLIGLSPERITVYNLTGRDDSLLSEALKRVFKDRVKFFS